MQPRVLPYTEVFLHGEQGGSNETLAVVRFMLSLFLIVVAMNVAVLVYARTVMRTGEIAVRTALGATRARIVTQLFAEAFVLSGLSSLVGLGSRRHRSADVRRGTRRHARRRRAVLDAQRHLVRHDRVHARARGACRADRRCFSGAARDGCKAARSDGESGQRCEGAAWRDVDGAHRRAGRDHRRRASSRAAQGVGDDSGGKPRAGLRGRRVSRDAIRRRARCGRVGERRPKRCGGRRQHARHHAEIHRAARDRARHRGSDRHERRAMGRSDPQRWKRTAWSRKRSAPPS